MSEKRFSESPSAEILRDILREEREKEDRRQAGSGKPVDISVFGRPEELGYRFSDYARRKLRSYSKE